ncbi:MAG: hypothetical protein V7709_05400 [Halioglobus sp.]
MKSLARYSAAFFCAYFVITCRAVAIAENPLSTATGSAYDRSSGNLIYREFHFCDLSSTQCSVDYRDVTGELIAQKLLDYRTGPHSPSLVVKNFRKAEQADLTLTGNPDWVVDAGFDNYVRSKWDVLDSGEVVKFPLLVPGFEKPLKMRAQRVDEESCFAAELCLEIVLDSWLLGMLVDPITVSYSRPEKKLLRFQGISNLRGIDGESLDVDIRYHYSDPVVTSSNP